MNHTGSKESARADELPEEILQSLREETCLLLVFSRPIDHREPAKLTIKPVAIRGETRYQVSIREGSKERHENLTPTDAIERCRCLFAESYRECHAFTKVADLSARRDRRGTVRLKRSSPTHRADEALPVHDRAKNYLIPEGTPCPFLIEMGVMSKSGQVLASKRDKFRQINRFLEFIRDVIPELPSDRPWNVIDFGCGKSYLTFALHYLLTHVSGHAVRIIGLDRNAEIIRHCAEVTQRLELKGLEFRAGNIADFSWTDPVDLVVSLHACDTATDDVLAQAVAWRAKVILAVPCCQHEVARVIEAPTLNLLQKHGIMKEQLSAMATDALRAQILELCGYRTQVIEFIEWEHTPKNLLIRGLRRPEGFIPAEAQWDELQGLKRTLGLNSLHLERQLTRLACDPFTAPAKLDDIK